MKLLEGFRMVEVGAFFNGVGCGFILGDLGADVIKVEDPIHGDSYRGMTQMYGDAMSVKGRHVGFETANRNKRGITLDLKRDEGKAVLYDLIKGSDVFCSNYNPDILARLGADCETLRKHNPRLIYATASAYGEKGSLSRERAFDVIGLARSGMMWTMGNKESDEPTPVAGALCDHMGSVTMAFGIVCALLGREKKGLVQELHTSLVGSAIFLNAFAINVGLLRGKPWARHSREHSKNPLSNYYRCADSKWILLSEPQSERFWPKFIEAMGLDHVANDQRFTSSLARRENCDELIRILDGTFATRPRDEWLRLFKEHQVGLAHSPVQDIAEVACDPQVLENEYIVNYEHPVFGPVKVIGYPVSFSKTPPSIQREAPEHGQHTEEVLSEVLGYSWERIAQLKEEGII